MAGIAVTYLNCGNAAYRDAVHAFVKLTEQDAHEFVAPLPWRGLKCGAGDRNVGVFVAEVAKKVVGWAVCKVGQKMVYISAISTKAVYKGVGVGTALMTKIMDVYSTQAFAYLLPINGTHGFYEKNGFRSNSNDVMYRALSREPTAIEMDWIDNMEVHGVMMEDAQLKDKVMAPVSSLRMAKKHPDLFGEVMDAYKEDNIDGVRSLLEDKRVTRKRKRPTAGGGLKP